MPQPWRPKGSKKAEQKEPPPERAEMSAIAGPVPKFGQALGSSDKEVREKAVKALERYLKSAHSIEELELRKIWKALFYCFWHSDKPRVQADLAERLAALMHALPSPEKAWLFVQVFWFTICREWTGIDRLRLDKFYGLLRCSVTHAIRLVRQSGWAKSELATLATVLSGEGGPLHAKAPVGLRYFMCDYFMPALIEAVRKDTSASGPMTGDALLALLEPFVQLCGTAEDDVTLRKLVEGVIQPVLLGGVAEDEDDDEEGEEDDDDGEEEEDSGRKKQKAAPCLPQPLEALAERLFTLASDKVRTKDRNRRLLYALQQRVEGLAERAAAEAAEAAAAAPPSSSKKRAKVALRAAEPAEAARKVDQGQLATLKNMIGKKKKMKTVEVEEADASASNAAAKAAPKAAAPKAAEKAAAKEKAAKAEAEAAAKREAEAEAKAAEEEAAKAKAAKAAAARAAGPPPEFQAAKKFEGRRAGCVFKKGPKGVGYYLDRPPVAKVFAKGGKGGGGGKRKR